VNRAEQYDSKKANRGYALIGVGLVIFVLLILSATVSPGTFGDLFN
jgi:type II secretory pathway pseudopilin PulG